MPSKQVLVVNRSLALPSGKLAAQVAHAAVGAFLVATEEVRAEWINNGMPKIVVHAADADFLLHVEAAATERRIPTCLVRDAGRTVVPEGTITCLGLGPADSAIIDPLTREFPLL
jgi:PTH2 family peptidyl-tRNA hydrolase